MKTLKKIMICILIIAIIIQYPGLILAANNGSYDVTMVPDKTAVDAGDTVKVTLVIDNINVGDIGLGVYAGIISYDTNIFELDENTIKGVGDWVNPTIRKKAMQEGEHVQEIALTAETKSGEGHTTRQEVATFVFKSLEDSEIGPTSIEMKNFHASTGVQSVYTQEEIKTDIRSKGSTVTELRTNNGVITVPEEINGRTVTDIAENAVKDLENVKTVIIPETVVYIPDDFLKDGNGNIKENITIECKEGSYAEEFAKANQINYEMTDKTIDSISVDMNTVKTTYGVRETLDLAGGKLNLNYSDGKSSTIDIQKGGVSVTGFNSSTGGEKTITVTYKGKTTTYKINVITELSSISIKNMPDKTTYIQGYEDLDLTGGKITLTYNDGSTSDLDMSDNSIRISGFNNNTVGQKTITVEYGGKSTTFNINITEKSIRKIEVKTMPTKTTYIENYELLNLNGGELLLTYDDGTTGTISMTASGVQTSGFSNATVGTKTITINYGGKSTTFNVEIVAKTLNSISVNKVPTKTQYIQNYEDLDLTGGLLTLTYDNRTTDTITMKADGVTTTGFNNSTIGKNTITVNYNGKSTTFDVEIIAKGITNVALLSEPTKKKYVKDEEELDLAGAKIRVTYNDNTSEEKNITTSEMTVTGYDKTKEGEQTISVTYEGRTLTFKVEVYEPQIRYEESEDGSGVKITKLKTEDNDSVVRIPEEIDGKPVTEIGKDIIDNIEDINTIYIPSSVTKIDDEAFKGNDEITIECISGSYAEQYAKEHDMNYELIDKTIDSISVYKAPNKTTYQKGEKLDLTGGRIQLTYTDGTTSPISMKKDGVNVSGYSNTKVGEEQLTVTYKEKSTTFNVNVLDAKSLKYEETQDGNGVVITEIEAENGSKELKIPSEINGKPVIEIKKDSIKNIKDLTTIYIPSSVTKIDDKAFEGNDEITIECESGSYAEEFAKNHNMNYELIDKTIKSITVYKSPDKTIYQKGEILDLTGGRLLLRYTDGSSSPISMKKYGVSVSGYDNTKAGRETITVEYKENTATFKVKVEDNTTTNNDVQQNSTPVSNIAKTILPKTGSGKALSVTIVMITVFGITAFIKYKKED